MEKLIAREVEKKKKKVKWKKSVQKMGKKINIKKSDMGYGVPRHFCVCVSSFNKFSEIRS